MLNKKQKYLQIALNSTLSEASSIISQIPLDGRIIIEAGTPLIKAYGIGAIRNISFWWTERIFGSFTQPESSNSFAGNKYESLSLFLERMTKIRVPFFLKGFIPKPAIFSKPSVLVSPTAPFSPYIVADLKCMDRGAREVEIAREGGASAAVALGQAPIETLDAFIENCEKSGLDAMIDMMNVDFPLEVLRQLKKPPSVVVLHRGVDEETFNPESEIPYHEIARIKNEYDIMVAVAGGDTFQEVQRAIFNDADIVVVWKAFYQSTAETAKLAQEFLKEVR